MTILSAKNTPRNTYTATAGQTAFTIGFEFFSVNDVKVYKNGTLMTYDASASTNTTYKITGTASASDDAYEFGAGGTVTFGSGVALNDSIVIIRDITIERTTDFNPSGAFDISTLNTQLDTIMSIMADTQEQTNRSVKLLDTDTTSATVTLPTNATRASKVLSFDASGNAEATLTTTGLSTLSGITSDITTVAGIASDVTTVSGISANVTTVAGISGNVTTVAGISSDVTTVAADGTDIGTVATNIANVNTVAGSISNINTVGTNISNVNTVAGVSSNVTTVAGSIANVNTVATNITGVNSFADRYRVGSADPITSLDAGDLFFNTTSNNLKYYDSSSWNVIASTFSIDAASDTNLTSVADGAMLLYDTGTSKWIDNVMSGDATMADTGAVTIANNAITTAKINADAVDGTKIADDSIDSEHYVDGSIDTAHIADDQITNAKMADDSVGSAELIDNSVGASALNVSGNGTSGQVLSSDADGSFSWVDSASPFSYNSVSGATPSLDVGTYNFFDNGTLTADTTLSFTSVPTEARWQYTAKSAIVSSYDISSAWSLDAGQEWSWSSYGYASYDFCFNNDGTKLFVHSYSDTRTYRHPLLTAYDLTTVQASDQNLNWGGQAPAGANNRFSADGTKLYINQNSGPQSVDQWNLSTAFDLSTATYSTTFNVSGQVVGTNYALEFSHDGTKMYVGSGTALYQYSLSTAWNVSTASYDSISLNPATGGTNGLTTLLSAHLSSDSTQILCIGYSSSTGYLRKYTLSTAKDLSSASFDSEVSLGSIAPYGLDIKPDGTKTFYSDYGVSKMYRASSGAFSQITLPSSVQNRADATATTTERVTYDFYTANGGTNVYLIGEELI